MEVARRNVEEVARFLLDLEDVSVVVAIFPWTRILAVVAAAAAAAMTVKIPAVLFKRSCNLRAMHLDCLLAKQQKVVHARPMLMVARVPQLPVDTEDRLLVDASVRPHFLVVVDNWSQFLMVVFLFAKLEVAKHNPPEGCCVCLVLLVPSAGIQSSDC